MELPPEEKELVPAPPSPESRLSEREGAAYRAWTRLSQPKLSPDTQAKFFALFLQGSTCEEITRLNRGFSLGQLVEARVEGEWDRRRDEYLEDLLGNVRGLVQQSHLEAVRFMVDQLAAVHKKWGDAARKYIQSGDEKDLKDFGIDGVKAYKTAVEVLQKLTGAENKPQEIRHYHTGEVAVASARRPLTSKEAAAIVSGALKK